MFEEQKSVRIFWHEQIHQYSMNKILNRLPFSRSVLSRAELEAIPLDNNLKEDVVKGKVSVFYIRRGLYFLL